MTRCTVGLLITLALVLLVAPRAADAQPVGRVPRISMLAAAPSLHVQLQPVEMAGPGTIEGAFGAATKGQADALLMLPDAMLWHRCTLIADLTAKHRLPALFPERKFGDAGGLLSYGPNVPANFYRAATYVDKILNGAKPGDLSVEQPMKFELVLNLKTAQASRTPDAGNICHGWTLVGWGTKLLPAYPNYPFTEYWLWTAAQDKHSKPMAFRITGQFPYARFSSFQTYSPTHTAALLHADIIPDEGSVNPTRIGADRYAENRSYMVWFVPAGSARAGKPNTIVMPADISATNLILRILRPDKDKPRGGVPLPRVEAFDEMTGEPVACPRRTRPTGVFRPLSIRKLLAGVPSPQDPISVYRFTGERYVPNQEAKFLAARLDFPYKRRIAALRFKVPTFPDTYSNPSTVFTGKEDTRYTGICVHGLIGTLTSECLADDELKKAPEGFANIIVGPEDNTLRHTAEARGYNYLSWSE